MARKVRRKASEVEFNLEAIRYTKRKAKAVVRMLEELEKGLLKLRPKKPSAAEVAAANAALGERKPRTFEVHGCACDGCDYCRGRFRGLLDCGRPAREGLQRCDDCEGILDGQQHS